MERFEDIKNTITPILKDQLENGSEIWLRINGNSMSPFIEDKEKVLVKKNNYENWRIGDIGIYRKNNILFTHRIVAIKWDQLLFKGDHNSLADNWIRRQEIWGKIILVDKGNRIWNLTTKKWERINNIIGIIQSPQALLAIIYNMNARKKCFTSLILFLCRLNNLCTSLMERILIFGR